MAPASRHTQSIHDETSRARTVHENTSTDKKTDEARPPVAAHDNHSSSHFLSSSSTQKTSSSSPPALCLTLHALILAFTLTDDLTVGLFAYLLILDGVQPVSCQESAVIFPELSLMGYSADPQRHLSTSTGGQICCRLQ